MAKKLKGPNEATKKWMETHVPDSVVVGPICTCSQSPYPHGAHTDELDTFEYHRRLRYVPIQRKKNRGVSTDRKGPNKRGRDNSKRKQSDLAPIQDAMARGDDRVPKTKKRK